jgi:regulator of sigma E protease
MIAAIQFLLSLSILVVLHEFGHFAPARWFGTRVEKFYLFFDPYFSLFSKKIGETEWGIGWLPLGGYVKISGMIDESFDSEQMKGEPQPWEFRSKPAWQRLIIMLGGVVVNFLLGFFIFGMIFWQWGKTYTPIENVTEGIYVDSIGMKLGLQDGDKLYKIGDDIIDRFSSGAVARGIIFDDATSITVMRNGSKVVIPVADDAIRMLTGSDNQEADILGMRTLSIIESIKAKSIAESIGLKAGDQLLSANGQSIKYFHQFKKVIQDNYSREITAVYLRDGQERSATFNIEKGEPVGFFVAMPETVSEKFGFITSMGMGVTHGIDFLRGQIGAFGKMFSGKINPNDSLGSFITIYKQYSPTWDWFRFWNMTAMLSMILGFLNLLPIPALDGGHVMFLIWEVITGRKPSDKVLEYSTFAGFLLLVIFMIYALSLDISRLF